MNGRLKGTRDYYRQGERKKQTNKQKKKKTQLDNRGGFMSSGACKTMSGKQQVCNQY